MWLNIQQVQLQLGSHSNFTLQLPRGKKVIVQLGSEEKLEIWHVIVCVLVITCFSQNSATPFSKLFIQKSIFVYIILCCVLKPNICKCDSWEYLEKPVLVRKNNHTCRKADKYHGEERVGDHRGLSKGREGLRRGLWEPALAIKAAWGRNIYKGGKEPALKHTYLPTLSESHLILPETLNAQWGTQDASDTPQALLFCPILLNNPLLANPAYFNINFNNMERRMGNRNWMKEYKLQREVFW